MRASPSVTPANRRHQVVQLSAVLDRLRGKLVAIVDPLCGEKRRIALLRFDDGTAD
jgi:hypothetical protein